MPVVWARSARSRSISSRGASIADCCGDALSGSEVAWLPAGVSSSSRSSSSKGRRERQKAYGRYDKYVDADPVRELLIAQAAVRLELGEELLLVRLVAVELEAGLTEVDGVEPALDDLERGVRDERAGARPVVQFDHGVSGSKQERRTPVGAAGRVYEAGCRVAATVESRCTGCIAQGACFTVVTVAVLCRVCVSLSIQRLAVRSRVGMFLASAVGGEDVHSRFLAGKPSQQTAGELE